MLKTTVYSLGNPGTFDITDKSDPLYYVARYSHEQSVNLYNMQQAGFEFRQATQSDVGAIETIYNDLLEDTADWLDSAVTASMEGEDIPSIPTMPDFFPAYEADSAISGIIWVIIRIAVQFFLLWLKKKLESGTDVSEIANILRKGLVGKIGDTEYSFIELLQNTPITIYVSMGGEVQDVTLGEA